MTDLSLPGDFLIEREGGACPYQAYGYFGEDRFYFRYRSDNASLSVGPPEPQTDKNDWSAPMPVHPPRLYAEIFSVYDDQYRGWLSLEEAHGLMATLLSLLKPPGEWAYGTHLDRLREMVDALKTVDPSKHTVEDVRNMLPYSTGVAEEGVI